MSNEGLFIDEKRSKEESNIIVPADADVWIKFLLFKIQFLLLISDRHRKLLHRQFWLKQADGFEFLLILALTPSATGLND
jgi:hypothetical protein